jgi:hypothetical protein
MKLKTGGGAIWFPVLGAVIGGAIGFAIGWRLAGGDIVTPYYWDRGAMRFVGMLAAFGAFGGYVATRRLVRGPRLTRSGFTLSYRRIEPAAVGYREMRVIAVGDLLAALRGVGYAPRVQACDDFGERRASLAESAPLAGANVALRDQRVRGWVRVQLPPPPAGTERALGLIEVWSRRDESAEELALFTLRALDALVGGLAAARDTSRLGDDPAALLTSELPARPRALER